MRLRASAADQIDMALFAVLLLITVGSAKVIDRRHDA